MSQYTDKILMLIANQLQLQNSVLLSGKDEVVDSLLAEHAQATELLLAQLKKGSENEIRTKIK